MIRKNSLSWTLNHKNIMFSSHYYWFRTLGLLGVNITFGNVLKCFTSRATKQHKTTISCVLIFSFWLSGILLLMIPVLRLQGEVLGIWATIYTITTSCRPEQQNELIKHKFWKKPQKYAEFVLKILDILFNYSLNRYVIWNWKLEHTCWTPLN